MKKIVSVFTFLLFLIFSNSLLAEVDIELLKNKYLKCENENYRHECFDENLYSDVKEIGYFRNNSLWDGQYFQNDILIFEYVNGEKVAKSFCEEKEDGWLVCPSGNKYKAIDGGYIDEKSQRQGQFVFEFSNGDKYKGEWKDGEMQGQGTYIYSNGDKYLGEFKKGDFHGQGTYYYLADNEFKGDIYSGEYRNDSRHGQGTYIFADGSKDVGEWEIGNLNGYAIQYNADGSIFREGIFKDNEFLYAETREKREPSKLDKYKSTCEEIGFTPGTEKFGDCVIKLMD